MYHHNSAEGGERRPIYRPAGRKSAEIAADVEAAIAAGRAPAGTLLPPVRSLASELGVAAGTVAAAYRLLSERGVVEGNTRSGTVVRARPGVAPRRVPVVPPGTRDLATGNPDPALLPRLAAVRVDQPRLYGDATVHDDLREWARASFKADGIDLGAVTVMGGALDAIERALQVHLRPGMRVAVEDPGYAGALDLVAALGLVAEPVPIDDDGVTPSGLAAAFSRGAQAVILTPRAQNPTGAALTATRADELASVLAAAPDALVIEDDHAGWVAGARAVTVTSGRAGPTMVVRSCSKALGPDLRAALVAGDERTIAAVEARQAVGAGWVSHILQSLVLDAIGAVDLDSVSAAYRERREVLISELERRGVAAHGRSGLNVWIPVPEEGPVVASMAARGWAIAPGARYRIASPPAVRVTVSSLLPEDAAAVATGLADTLGRTNRTRAS